MEKSVEKMIFDKFRDKISGDESFKDIWNDLIDATTQKKPKKDEIEKLLRQYHDEDIEFRD